MVVGGGQRGGYEERGNRWGGKKRDRFGSDGGY